MSVWAYTDDGSREPFDPQEAGAHLRGCLLCNRPIAAVGIFIPYTDQMRAVVARLRTYQPPPQSTAGLVYGLCKKHVRQDVTARVEVVLVALAGKVTVQ